MRSVSAIVPAYNEAARIGTVLEILVSYDGFTEIVVVDDGSTDETARIVETFGVRVVKNRENKGKGAAMERGAQEASGEILFFCDADLIGLSHQFIDEVIRPVTGGEVDMFVGARKSKIRRWRWFSWAPLLDGQRAMTRMLWMRVPSRFKRRFEIEVALNWCAARSERGYAYKAYDEISHVRKEEKRGFLKGKLSRIRMCWEVSRAYGALKCREMVSVACRIRGVRDSYRLRRVREAYAQGDPIATNMARSLLR